MGLAGTGDGHIPCLHHRFLAGAVGEDPFPGYDDIGVFIETVFVAADGSTLFQGQVADFLDGGIRGGLVPGKGEFPVGSALPCSSGLKGESGDPAANTVPPIRVAPRVSSKASFFSFMKTPPHKIQNNCIFIVALCPVSGNG